MTAPLVLAIETSSPAASVALLRGEVVEAARRFDAASRGGGALHPGVAAMLDAAGAEAITAVAVGIGPGSYTGTRIGLVFAKTFAFARGLPVVGVCALEAVAMRACVSGVAVVSIAANATAVYGAAYACEPGRVPAVVRAPAYFTRDVFERDVAPLGFPIELPPEACTADDVGRLAARARLWEGAAPPDADAIAPLYLQPPAPERG